MRSKRSALEPRARAEGWRVDLEARVRQDDADDAPRGLKSVDR